MRPLTYSPDYLDERRDPGLQREAIKALRAERIPQMDAPRWQTMRDALKATAHFPVQHVDLKQDAIVLGQADDLDAHQRAPLMQALEAFRPWKKGPFRLFGEAIDTEWRSDWKWARVARHSPDLRGLRVADIGCNNGYFMLRMAAQEPACVVGFEPVARHALHFQLLQQWARQPNLYFELLGVEHLHLYQGFFDVIFCLGILYHHTDPVGLLRKLRSALAPKGRLIVDCQGIPGDEPIALTPRKRYAGASGVWFLPTQSCLEHWMIRAGLADVSCFFAAPLSVEEQRRTPWADINSLAESLDPQDPSRTIEGYPAPWRYYVSAKKG